MISDEIFVYSVFRDNLVVSTQCTTPRKEWVEFLMNDARDGAPNLKY